MGVLELFLTGIALSMDAFAVAVCKGLGMPRLKWGQAFVIALFFGGFQALMPFLGWALGSQFAEMIAPVDHWVAFVLLAGIGGKMVWDAVHETGEDVESLEKPLDLKELTALAVATSIDALAVGITFAFLNVNILPAITIIGLTTFALSLAGVVIGHKFGAAHERVAGIIGGIVLIVLGLRILLEHLGIIAF